MKARGDLVQLRNCLWITPLFNWVILYCAVVTTNDEEFLATAYEEVSPADYLLRAQERLWDKVVKQLEEGKIEARKASSFIPSMTETAGEGLVIGLSPTEKTNPGMREIKGFEGVYHPSDMTPEADAWRRDARNFVRRCTASSQFRRE